MKHVAPTVVLLSLAFATTPARAETIYDGLIVGEIFSSSSYTSGNTSRPPCVGSSLTGGPVIAFGTTGFNSPPSCGTILGTFTARAVLDGVAVPSGLLPVGSFYRSRMGVRHFFCPGATGPCSEAGCSLVYTINGRTTFAPRATDTYTIDIPAAEATSGLFQFDFANHEVTWGAGCGVVGSIVNRWFLHTPAPVRAAVLSDGDSPPATFAGAALTVDKSSGPGGIITGTRVASFPPALVLPQTPDYPGYWEIHTDIAPGALTADIRVQFDPALITPGVQEQDLRLWRVDPVTNHCVLVPTTIDTATHTATGTGLDRFAVFILSQNPAPTATRRQSWGEVKQQYR